MTDPTLTIGISFYNTARTLPDLARSIFAQTFTDWELILIDDGSTDGGADILRQIDDPRVRVIRDATNRGRSARYNAITRMARGRYIARFDADDLCHPRRFEKQVAFLEEHPEVDVVSCDLLGLTDRDELVSRSHGPTEHEAICRTACKMVYLQHGGIIGRTEWFRRFPYHQEYRICVDQALLLSSYRESCFANIPEPLYFYRIVDTYNLHKHCLGELTLARLIWRYSRPHYPMSRVLAAVVGRFARLGVYVATELLGVRRRLIARRYARPNEEDACTFDEALAVIGATAVPGLSTVGRSTHGGPLMNRSVSHRVRACHVSTVGVNIKAFFRGQFAFLRDRGFDYTVITSEPTREELGLPEETEYIPVSLPRAITPCGDLQSLWRLWRIFRRGRFDMVQYVTPKGALLGSIAAWGARVPVRLYLLWGIYYMGQTGLARKLLKGLEKLTFWLSTDVTFDGFAIRQFAIDEGLCPEATGSVIGEGGDNGIDLSLYQPGRYVEAGRDVRRQWEISDNAVVVGTVGRLVGDKGINELVAAFQQLSEKYQDLFLLLVGPQEERNAPGPETLQTMRTHPRIVLPGAQADVLPYYAAMDIFCLPTYREGFSAVNLEAAAMELPVVTTDVIGAQDSIIDEETGVVVPVRSSVRLSQALERLIRDADLRGCMGRAGRKWVEDKFEQRRFWQHIYEHRVDLLVSSGRFGRESGKLRRRQPTDWPSG